MNPCILFIDPSHGSADRYLPRWNMANCYINCHCIEHRVRVEPRVHSGLERLGVLRGILRGISGGRGRAGRQSSRLLRAIEITRVSLKSPRTTRSVAISTPPDRQLLSQSLGNPNRLCRHPQKSVSKRKFTPVVWYSPSAPLEVGNPCTTG